MTQSTKGQRAFLPGFLGFVIMLFVSILILTYLIARKTDPVILDEHGHVRSGGGQHARQR